MPATLLNAVAQSSAQRLVNSFFEGLMLAALVWAVLRLMPRQNASTRFSLWMAALLSIATLPVAEMLARVDKPITAAVPHASLTLPASWGTALFSVWALIAFFLLARVAFGLVQLVRLRASAEEVDLTFLPGEPRQTLGEFQQHRRVSLCVSDRVSVPTAVGLFRPAVVLPHWTLAELTPADLNSVLVHELAHLRRRDDWTNLLQKIVRAVFFFHPAVWWIESRLSLEREMACDEHVLASVPDPRAYAACLVSLAERGFLHRAVALAQGAVHRLKDCSARVAQILDGGAPRTARVSLLALFSGASGLVLLLGGFAQAPDLIAFNPTATTRPVTAASEASTPAVVSPAAWRPESQAAPSVTPAVYKPEAPTTKQLRKGDDKGAKINRSTPAFTARSKASDKSAQMLYRAGLTTAPGNSAPAALLIVRQANFYSDGTAVWSVSVYRMTVFQPQPHTPNDISRKAI
jgi:beta-lactamase regulating signal transducer with metallopeptidase domain